MLVARNLNQLIVKVLNELHFVEDLGSGRRNLKRYAPLYYTTLTTRLKSQTAISSSSQSLMMICQEVKQMRIQTTLILNKIR